MAFREVANVRPTLHIHLPFSSDARVSRSMYSRFNGLDATRVACRPQLVVQHFGAHASLCARIAQATLHSISSSALKDVTSDSGDFASSRAPLVVVSFYKFADLPDCDQMRAPLRDLCEAHRVSGGIILATEGINGSLCGTRESLEKVMSAIQSDERLADMQRNEAPAGPEDEIFHHGHTCKSPLGAGGDAPFRWNHVRVKLKKELVPLGVPGVDPSKKVGKYVKPEDWNALIRDPDTVVVDVRNAYEIRVGKFKKAVDPHTVSFREFPAWVDQHLLDGHQSRNNLDKQLPISQDPDDKSLEPKVENKSQSSRRIAMYCTGGIRCEKATSFLLHQGFEKVYHLEGGILKYLEKTAPADSLWEGECFVFDKRVTVGHGLKQGTYQLCYACKKPVNDADMASPLWEEGVSCPHCIFLKSDSEKRRARARQEQFQTWGVVGGPDKGQRKPSCKKQDMDPPKDQFFTRWSISPKSTDEHGKHK